MKIAELKATELIDDYERVIICEFDAQTGIDTVRYKGHFVDSFSHLAELKVENIAHVKRWPSHLYIMISDNN